MISSSSLRILGFIGSPRRDGNTARLVTKLLESAEQAGASVECVRLPDLDIRPCQGCLSCYPQGSKRCAVHDDDMAGLVQRMQGADIWVLGTPVYCYSPTSQFKTFFDRWISLPPEVYEGTRAAVVVPLHDVAAAGADLTLAIIERMLKGLRIPCDGRLVCPDLLHKEDLDRHPEYLNQAAALGRKLARSANTESGAKGAL